MDNVELSPKTERVEKRILTSEELTKIMFLSFMFSQGNGFFQNKILSYIRTLYGKQNEDYAESVALSFAKKYADLNEAELKVALAGAHRVMTIDYTEPEKADIAIMESVKQYFKNLTKEDGDFQISTPEEISFGIWERDLYFLLKKDGRPDRKAESIGSDTLKDPFFSFGVQYIIRKKPTGEPAYEQMLKQVQSCALNKNATETIKLYNKTHPNSVVSEEELSVRE